MEQPQNPQQTAGKTFTVTFQNLQALKNAYMPYVRDGAIFVATKDVFHLEDYVTLTLTLPDNHQAFTFTGEVIWITPSSAQTQPAGIGVQCAGAEGESFQKTVQTLLANMSGSAEESETM
ncbi:MAG TPA: PilZ domain-containing protein [Coxiellaceae bacterium]|nr:PilZ domain-containing protein [Coxiellaceae bacterium]